MYLLGHLGIALLVFAPVAYWLCRVGRTHRVVGGTGTMLLLASVPDVDRYLPGVAHRGVTHTVWAALAVGAALGLLWVCYARTGRRGGARFVFLLGSLSVLGHLLGDLLTPMGIRPFAPLFGAEYTLRLVAARHPGANLALLVAGVLVVAPALRRAWVLSVRPDADAAGS